MTDWHPSLSDADPAGAWYSTGKLAEQRQAEQAERDFHAMLKRRRDFDLMLGNNPDEIGAEQRARAWQLATDEPWPHHMSDAEIQEAAGLAQHLK